MHIRVTSLAIGLLLTSCQRQPQIIAKFCSDIGRDITVYEDYSYEYDNNHFSRNPCSNMAKCFQIPFPIFAVDKNWAIGEVYRTGSFDVRLNGPADFIMGDMIFDRQDFGYSTRTAVDGLPPFGYRRLQYGVSYNSRRGYFAIVSGEFGALTICDGRLSQPQ